ncbi:hypothetical protein CTA1_6378 [Colletotrichum tanaceti]|uniref:Secreted protein n=1 Tax=Colletotrichum tanaceti TaxID=1306861 RepID=A0A4V6DJM9_9PEZI|nr:hypothetical protein CTA1_6378 [Colletotrichum tanaceti]
MYWHLHPTRVAMAWSVLVRCCRFVCRPSGSAENNLDKLGRRIHVVFSIARHALPTDIHRSPHLACIRRGSPDVRGKYHYPDTLRRYPYARSPVGFCPPPSVCLDTPGP